MLVCYVRNAVTSLLVERGEKTLYPPVRSNAKHDVAQQYSKHESRLRYVCQHGMTAHQVPLK